MDDNRQLEELDKKYIWHPFTQMQEWVSEKPIIISEGRDCFIRDIYGRWYLDGVSSLWVNIFGHRKKEINDAIHEQLEKISHSTLLGLSNLPAIKLAEKIVQIVNNSLLPHSCAGEGQMVDLNEYLKSGDPPHPPFRKGG